MGTLAEEAKLLQENATLRDALRKAHRKLAKREDDREATLASIRGAVEVASVVAGRIDPLPRPERDRRKSPEVALLHLTDWQIGKLTPDYSTEVAKKRVAMIVEKAIKLRDIQHADHPVREIHVMLGGDMVEGLNIFPGQEWEVDSDNYTQLLEARNTIGSTILSLLENFEHVTVWEVDGNHGRIGRRGENPREFNLDRIVYEFARTDLQGQPRLTWMPPQPWYQIVRIENYRALLVHGDQVKAWGGNTPVHGLLKKANAWAAGAIPEKFLDIYLGHLHQPMTFQMANGGVVRMTPSIESGSAYAQEFMAAHGRPGQRLVFVDPRKGRVTADYLLWLDD